MKKYFLLLIIPLLVLAGTFCEKHNDDPVIVKDIDLSGNQQQMVSNDNEFSLELFRKINENESDNNVFISPLSVSMALGMTWNGAEGTTREALSGLLGFGDLDYEDVNLYYNKLISQLPEVDSRVKLSIANSIWCRQGFEVEKHFTDLSREYFLAQITNLDFNDPSSVGKINNWVADHTHNRIDKIINQIDADAVMFLINAIYFKGTWKYSFDASNTANHTFYLSGGKTSSVPTMDQEAEFPLFTGEQYRALSLPYGAGNFVMTVVLPDEGIDINSLIARLNQQEWRKIIAVADKTAGKVHVQLPKFKFSWEKTLNEVLKSMGAGIAFDPVMASFTGINTEGNLYISRVKHKSFIEVNEEGTEAAAVTSVQVNLTSAGSSPQFIVNRPFVFIIMEKSSGAVLFAGKVLNPVEE
ncbi:MAG TPA: serpin family protein [Bacteroidales bacterium]|nr:serpin family protein [Bacteroidales bacterium]